MELFLILLVSALVIGPDRIPQFAADLAQWIRRMRAYSQHLMRDFNDVMGDLEKEVGTSREDWKEIASVVRRNSGDVVKELNTFARQVERSGDIESAKTTPAIPPSIVFPVDQPSNGNGTTAAPETETESGSQPKTEGADQPWFVPEQTTPRRRAAARRRSNSE
jgi:Sec-independent protein translocase protein TatA